VSVPGPAPRAKRYHLAAAMDDEGHVSALCFNPPRAINMRRASWTNRREAVTCPKCLAIIAVRVPVTPGGKEGT
jgi:hypothetical protein